jgi:deferrochelatase/peroxidase EfeB
VRRAWPCRRYPPGGGPTLKAGEFVLGYPDETGNLPPMPEPEVLGRNGTFLVWRKLHTHVAAFRRYLRDNASGPEEELLLAAKIVGHWPSGAPLILAPEHDDPDLGADDQRNNDFLYPPDPRGPACPHCATPDVPIRVTRRSSVTCTCTG